MKKAQRKPRTNQKVKRKSARTNKGLRYTMTRNGLVPSIFTE